MVWINVHQSLMRQFHLLFWYQLHTLNNFWTSEVFKNQSLKSKWFSSSMKKEICMYSKLKSIMRYFSCNYYFVLFSKIFLWKWALNYVVWYLKTSEAQELFKSIDIKRSSGIATTIFTLTEFSFDLLLLSNTTTLRIWEHFTCFVGMLSLVYYFVNYTVGTKKSFKSSCFKECFLWKLKLGNVEFWGQENTL